MNFTIWPSPINRSYVIHLYTIKQYFLHISNIHSFHVALFSFYTFFILHFFFILHISMLQSFMLLSSSLHYFQVPLFSCCIFSMLYFFLVVLSKSIKRLSFTILYIKSLIETLSDISSFRRRYDKYNLLRVPMQACS